MPRKTVIIGGGAAGLGAAGGAKLADPSAEVVVYIRTADAVYGSAGTPADPADVEDFEKLLVADKQGYIDAGVTVNSGADVTAIDTAAKTITVDGATVSYDSLVIAAGSGTGDTVPGSDLTGVFHVNGGRSVAEWNDVIARTKSAVVVNAGGVGLEIVTALAKRGVETHLVEAAGQVLPTLLDPDFAAIVQDGWTEAGVHLHLNTSVEEFVGEGGAVRAVRTSDGEIVADLVVVATNRAADTSVAAAAGITVGPGGGIVVDDHMKTSAAGVWAAGDVAEVAHGGGATPLLGLTTSHAFAEGRAAGTNAAGGDRVYKAVRIPWSTQAGVSVVGGTAFNETSATAAGIAYVKGEAQGISRARYYPGVNMVKVKLLAEPGTLRLIGAQLLGGGEGIKERANFLAQAVKSGLTLTDLSTAENVYSPAIGALNEPMVVAATNGVANAQKG
ncbi:FAD-dependent oxidoreductase [Pseudonocardia sp. N23]|uniref:FAD-dependent oxidoreductase n=1 Tax=Pseudonocardia sp. N23 TaxID=1987376 RepID=UPI000BFC7B27|nr:FAD-dependent oxidoreductase [Pseudonocardia sp. N23]GAY08679.1 putative pyridine nucleotide-disulphide oxidoreductase [Pseudonocardia sp. N23]